MLKELIESNPGIIVDWFGQLSYCSVCSTDYVNYSDFTVYEIADMLKLYFRELPEVLLTDKLSEVLISVQEGNKTFACTNSTRILLIFCNRHSRNRSTASITVNNVADAR